MSTSVLFLLAAFASSVVLGAIVFLFSRPRVPKNGYQQFHAQRHALSNVGRPRPVDRYGSRGVTLLESHPDSNPPGRSTPGA